MRLNFARACLAALCASLCVAACGQSTNPVPLMTPPDLPGIKPDLAFTCAHEAQRIPPRHPEADQLYHHARWLDKNNYHAQDPAVYPKIERLIRIATAYGHDKANLELRNLLEQKKAYSPNPIKESVDLVQELIQRGIPGGYYDMGRYLSLGYGVQADVILATKYYRRSADLGSPDGQYLVGDKLSWAVKYGQEVADIGWAMYRCAAEQGHHEAANDFGIHLQHGRKYKEAVEVFSMGVKAGSSQAANVLATGFRVADPKYVSYLGYAKDLERAARYAAIAKLLSQYEYASPKVPELDEIVPLPPAKLPPWDGTLQWVKAFKTTVPPLPTEQRIVEMAKAKGLDPQTGRPLAWGNSGPTSP